MSYFIKYHQITKLRWRIKTNQKEKQDFYSDANTVKQYEKLRFSNVGGQFVHQSEERAFSQFLAQCTLTESLLDIPCGTGRMLPAVLHSGFNKVDAADYSDEMLSMCRTNTPAQNVNVSKQDIYATTFPDQSFSVIISSRFLFHCDDQEKLFSEFERLVVPQGYLIFDSLQWSPRTWTQLFAKQLGGKIYTNNKASIHQLAEAHGFRVLGVKSILIFPSFIYNFIPGALIRPLKWVESIWPDALKTKRIWMLKKR